MSKKYINYSEIQRDGSTAAREAVEIAEIAGKQANLPSASIETAKAVAIGAVAAKSVEKILPR